MAQSDQELLRRGKAFERQRDGQSAILVLRPLLNKKNPSAQFIVGTIYLEGSRIYPGITRDIVRGWELIKSSAESGDPDAQYFLANEYAYGTGSENSGLPHDRSKGVYWFKKAATHGDVGAMILLADCYREGWGTNIEFVQAIKWYRKASSKGNSVAMAKLARMYLEGEGVPQNFIEAHAWLNLAATQSKSETVSFDQERDALAAKMNSNQIEKAQARAKVILAELRIN
ncbi:tetratricopeptide repeat protein [Geothrix edaphica]|nr:tetratricopeptide repeat protein [Geothrix edaphica]